MSWNKVCFSFYLVEHRVFILFKNQAPAGRYARSLRLMLRRAAERRVLPDDSPQRLLPDVEFEEAANDHQYMHRGAYPQQQDRSQFRPSTVQQYVAQMQSQPQHQMQPNVYGTFPPGMYAGSTHPQPGYYDAYPEVQPWGNMDLNAGAVMVGGMEAYMIPVG